MAGVKKIVGRTSLLNTGRAGCEPLSEQFSVSAGSESRAPADCGAEEAHSALGRGGPLAGDTLSRPFTVPALSCCLEEDLPWAQSHHPAPPLLQQVAYSGYIYLRKILIAVA